MATPKKLANIVVGIPQTPVVARTNNHIDYSSGNNTYPTSYNNAQTYNISDSQVKPGTHELVSGSDSYLVEDCDHITGNIVGVVYNNKCITTTPTIESYSYLNGTQVKVNQVSPYLGMLFNQYVKSDYGNKWVFECIFKPSTSTSNLISYGYSRSLYASNLTYYRVYIESKTLKLQYYWCNGSTWYHTNLSLTDIAKAGTVNTTYTPNETALTSTTLDQNTWYHLCLSRIGDGTTAHGSGDRSATLCYLTKINNYEQNASQYEGAYNSAVWYAPKIKNSGYSACSNFGMIGSTSTSSSGAGNVGRLSGNYEMNGAKNTSGIEMPIQFGASGISLAGKILLYGGAYSQQELVYNLKTNDIERAYSDYSGFSNPNITNVLTKNSSSSQSVIQNKCIWKSSITI